MTKFLCSLFLAAWVLGAADSKVGVFDGSGDVGETPKKGNALFQSGEYRVTGGGANIWATADAFQFVWTKMSGDFSMSADVRFVGEGAVAHRKAALMIRQNLEAGSAYADVALHGDGLTSLQYRPAAGGTTLEMRGDMKAPTRLRIERRGSEFTLFAGATDGELKAVGPATVVLEGPVYVGLAVCSHDAQVLETAVFSNVKVEPLPVRPRILGVAHIGVFAHDYEKSRAYYRDFLGFEEPYSLSDMTFFKVNERQYIELFQEKAPNTDRLNHISVETDDIEGMRRYLESRGVKVPAKAGKGRIGNLSFTIKDPEGHGVEFVQYMPDGWTVREKGKHLPETRISQRIMHVGIIVTNFDRESKFYTEVLGFREFWRGNAVSSPTLSWVNMRVPEGEDYVEFMLFKEAPAETKRGVSHHLCLEVPDVAVATERLKQRVARTAYDKALEPKVGVNRKRQVNLFDPDGTRAELMEWNTVDGKPTPPSALPPPSATGDLLEPAEFAKILQLGKAPVVLSVAFPVLYKARHVVHAIQAGPGSKPEGIALMKQAVAGLPKDADLVIYCGCCPMDKCPNVRPAFQALKEMGFTKVRMVNIPTNMHTDWYEKGYPSEP